MPCIDLTETDRRMSLFSAASFDGLQPRSCSVMNWKPRTYVPGEVDDVEEEEKEEEDTVDVDQLSHLTDYIASVI